MKKYYVVLILAVFLIGCTTTLQLPELVPTQTINSELVGKTVTVEGIIATNTVVCTASGKCSYRAILVDNQASAEAIKLSNSNFATLGIRLKQNGQFLGCQDKTVPDENMAFGYKKVGVDCKQFELNQKYIITGKIDSEFTSTKGYATTPLGEKVPVGEELNIYHIEIESFSKVLN